MESEWKMGKSDFYTITMIILVVLGSPGISILHNVTFRKKGKGKVGISEIRDYKSRKMENSLSDVKNKIRMKSGQVKEEIGESEMVGIGSTWNIRIIYSKLLIIVYFTYFILLQVNGGALVYDGRLVESFVLWIFGNYAGIRKWRK